MSSRHSLRTNESLAAEPFRYPASPAGTAGETGEVVKRRWAACVAGAAGAEGGSREEEEKDEVRRRAFEEGSAAARAESRHQVSGLRQEIDRALREFAAERQSYFERAEEQIVRLSLTIVRKILHRESQIDPLLLTGIVRVALEKLDDRSGVKLRVHPQDIQKWKDHLASASGQLPTPELIADASLEPNRCILETELGSAEVGLETQVAEIERGFLDLLAQRPGTR